MSSSPTNGGSVEGGRREEEQQHDQLGHQGVNILSSPITEPMLMPELWDKVFEFLPVKDLEAVTNAAPEWMQLAERQKTAKLFPQVLQVMMGQIPIHIQNILPCRLVNRECRMEVDRGFPEIPQRIRVRDEMNHVDE